MQRICFGCNYMSWRVGASQVRVAVNPAELCDAQYPPAYSFSSLEAYDSLVKILSTPLSTSAGKGKNSHATYRLETRQSGYIL